MRRLLLLLGMGILALSIVLVLLLAFLALLVVLLLVMGMLALMSRKRAVIVVKSQLVVFQSSGNA